MKVDKKALAKHHFWILLGAFALVALILLIVIPVTVGGMIERKEAAIEAMSKGLDGKKNPKNKGQIAAVTEQTTQLGSRRETLQREMYRLQADLLSFPYELQALNKLDFGAKLEERDRTQYISEGVYNREYEEMAAIIKPTEFVGGWRSILQPVAWNTSLFPQTEEVWLSLEDMCVRREMLRIFHEANESVARFTPQTPLAADRKLPLQRTFKSRLWELKLVLDRKDRDFVFKGKLKNISGKRQGNIYRINLLVWVTDDSAEGARPIRLPIEQDALAAGPAADPFNGQEMDIPDTKVTINQVPTGLFRVEQELNDRFVPIKQLRNLVLGKNAGHRMADKPLKKAKFSETKEDPAAAGTTAGVPATPMMGGSASGKPGMGMPGMAGPGMSGAAGTATDETPNHVAKTRYIDLTEQVRRMPVAFVIVIDQANVNDVLIALANSPRMRFQTTQTHLQRLYGVVTGGSASEPGPSGSSSGGDTAGGGRPGGAPGPGAMMPMGPGPGMGSGAGPPKPGLAGGPAPGLAGGPAAPPPSGGSPAGGSSSGGEVQHAGLVELTVYGVANIYERPKEAAPGAPSAAPPAPPLTPPAAVPPATPATPPTTPKAPTPPAPAPGTDKPVVSPGDKPVEKPADKPAGKAPPEPPAGKPADKAPGAATPKPADKTPPGPTGKPGDKDKN
jgi:hypothetical protein